MSDYLAGIYKFVFWFFCCIAILLTTLFWYRVDQRSSFEQQASSIISNDGGINKETQNKLDNLSHQYHVSFNIKKDIDAHSSYGSEIEYTLNMNVNWFANIGLHDTQKAYVSSTYGS
ncbi:hypothetical protein DY037_05425 [Apilactobacillus micheneri]|uniref:hypothetical protein n=1 Tax=Apilactobacillus micheneri TaxID=1899430 RepID=UPI0011264CB8|nr:hypothetical protein [Apilactobacillus micheneri]TPR49221.1 hypothetical protein DY037_05425 [Apilactobacillus micheneri]